uniref:Uncharacterized protein n=1 Tax=Romanomermis culicivorax TaxID=13658 RepID=A0A915HZW6_ROMCU
STAAVIFWQWANQSFNALVNYTNRNAKSTVTPGVITFSYCTATSAALITALGLKKFLAKRGGSLVQRLVPLAAVYAAQCVNVPLMRQNELKHGLSLIDEKDVERGKSKLAAVKAIGLVVFSRNVIATPSMLFTPILMEYFEKQHWFRKNRSYLNTLFQVFFSALFLLPMVPIGCALFPQKNTIKTCTLEKYEPTAFAGLRMSAASMPGKLYFNKGL